MAIIKLKLPRKLKKRLFYCPIDNYELECFVWLLHKDMVITRNYLRAHISITLSTRELIWIENGLLKDNYWINRYKTSIRT